MVRVVVLGCLLALALASSASAAAYLPPKGKVWHGVASGRDISDFTDRVGKRPAVWQHWIQWGDTFEYAYRRAAAARTRVMLHLSTAAAQNAPGRISPGAIARGEGDGYLLRLNRSLAEHGDPVYLRLMAEMNNCDLAYSAYDCNGRRRSRDHSAARFRQAWRRVVLVVRGGSVARIDRQLRRLRLPAVRTGEEVLDRPKVAFLWSPMTAGSPMIAGLRPQVYWPGRRYVDWVSTSFYSRFPNFRWLTPFYRSFAMRHRRPFALGEWAMWGSDSASFPRQLFAWVRRHPRTRMMVYNQGHNPAGPFRLKRFPAARREIARALKSPRFAGLAPEHR